jgi:F-type H+-transporting ATPase subunit delta
VSILVNRYATALFEAATEAKVLEAVERDLGQLGPVVELPANRELLLDPRLPPDRARAMLHKLSAEMHPLTRRFLDLLVDHRRMEILPELQQAFRTQLLASRNTVEGVVESARSLSPDDVAKLAAAAGNALGKSVELTVVDKPELIGGVRLLVQNRLFDGSVATALDTLRKQWLSLPVA